MQDEPQHFADLPVQLLDWYEGAARKLPWRKGPEARARGQRPDPYHAWLAEIMLQQTTIPHATRYWQAFTARWPTIADLAAAKDEEVMSAWAGLGYYARARNLLKCARQVASDGSWPDTEAGLRELPGIGPYTAGALAALVFDRQASAVDGNVERVFARLLAAEGDWPDTKKQIRGLVSALVPVDRPGEFAEALMDLGATICTPRRPDCPVCPLRAFCRAAASGNAERYPVKPKKAPKPHRRGHVFVLFDGNGGVLTERRPDKGLLGGMLGLPTSAWHEADPGEPDFPVPAGWQRVGDVRHVFTHFSLSLQVWRGDAEVAPDVMTPRGEAVDSLPTVFAKALRLASRS